MKREDQPHPHTSITLPSVMAGSRSDVSSTGSYTIADLHEQTRWQAEMTKFRVSQLDELLQNKDITPKGLKAEKAEMVAWHYTRDEIAEWRKKQEKERPAPAILANRSGEQLRLDDCRPK